MAYPSTCILFKGSKNTFFNTIKWSNKKAHSLWKRSQTASLLLYSPWLLVEIGDTRFFSLRVWTCTINFRRWYLARSRVKIACLKIWITKYILPKEWVSRAKAFPLPSKMAIEIFRSIFRFELSRVSYEVSLRWSLAFLVFLVLQNRKQQNDRFWSEI